MIEQLSRGIVFLIVVLLLTRTFVQSHHGHGAEHGEDNHHGPANGHSGHADHNKAQSVEPKFLTISTWPLHKPKPKPTILYIFNTDQYAAWTDWSECLPRDCIQVRYRKCLDDSWKQTVDDTVRMPGCLSKFYAEKRPCPNVTECHRSTGEKLLNQWVETCGLQPEAGKFTAKILGGVAATPHSWPWTVRLSVKSRSGKSISFCGGTLVTPDVAVTAAHCLVSLNPNLPAGKPFKLSDHMPHSLFAHVGDHHRDVREKTQQDIRVNLAVIHPQYHRKLLTDGYDFALVYLSKPVNMSKEVNLACLPPKDTQFDADARCVAVGWGNNKKPVASTFDSFQSILDAFLRPRPFHDPFGAPSWQWAGRRRHSRKPTERLGTAVLHEVELPIIDNKKCLKHFVDLNPDLHICAGSKGKDTCSGDSGGGLYCQLPKSDQWMLAGVTSYGLSLGCGQNPGIYTSTEAHREWIMNNLVYPVKQDSNTL